MKREPSLYRWEEEGAITELARLAAELPHVGADKAWAPLERLIETQRIAIDDVLGRGRTWLPPAARCEGGVCVSPRPWSELGSDEGDTPERRARVAERLRQLGELVGHRTVEVEVSPVEWGDDDRLAALADALAARPELIGPAVSTDLSRRVIGLTVTVAAHNREAARAVAAHALDEEIGALGLGHV